MPSSSPFTQPVELFTVEDELGERHQVGFWAPLKGDWAYEVEEMTITGPVTPAVLTAIRPPGPAQEKPAGAHLGGHRRGCVLDPTDSDERAIVAYITAQLTGDNPTTAVAAELGVKPNAAAQRVYRLRRDGRLPTVSKKGKI